VTLPPQNVLLIDLCINNAIMGMGVHITYARLKGSADLLENRKRTPFPSGDRASSGLKITSWLMQKV
jgi:hypothetical protein